MSKSRELWRISLGEPGLRLYLFERIPEGNIYREVWADGKRAKPMRSLGHANRERAKAQGYELLAKLKARRPEEPGTLTLAMLFDKWLASETQAAVTERHRKGNRRKGDRFEAVFGADRDVSTLCAEDVRRYTRLRMSGERPVRARTVESDVAALKAALNWAVGAHLIERNPLDRVALPREKNPRRPIATPERYAATLQKAGEVSPSIGPMLVLAHETGRRLSAIRKLKGSDVRDDGTALHFRADTDKMGYESTVPLSPDAQKAVREALHGRIGDVWLFPSPTDPAKPLSRHLARKWLMEAEKLAGLEPLDGSLWHAYRRKFASDMAAVSDRVTAALGGWKSPRTLDIYARPGREMMAEALQQRRRA